MEMQQNNIGIFMDEELENVEVPDTPKPNAPVEQILIGEDYYIDPPIIVRMNDLSHMSVIYNGQNIAPIHINKTLTRENKRRIERQLKLKTFFNGRGKQVPVEQDLIDDFIYEIEEFYLKYRDKYEAYETALDKWQDEFGEVEPDEVQEEYLKRCKPEYDQFIADEVEAEIREKSYGKYITDILNNMILGEKRDCIRELNILFGICNGQKDSSCFLEAIGTSEEGKSWMQEVILKYFIPEEYVFNAQFLTEAVMRDYDGRFFCHRICYRGDLGHATQKNFEDPSFTIAKQLITDKKYISNRRLSDGEGMKKTVLRADTFCMMYSSVVSLTKFNNQLSSRTTGFTPQDIDKEDIFEFQAELGNSMSPEKKLFDKSIEEAKRFQHYLKKCVNLDIDVTVEHMKKYLFRMVATSGRPELVRMSKRILNEFKSFCYLTHYELIRVGDNLYIPSLEQLYEFVELSIGETFVDVLDYNFMQMLVKGAPKLEPLTETQVDNCISEAIEFSMLSGDEPKKQRLMSGLLLTIDDLNDQSDYKRFRREFQDSYCLGRTIKETNKSYFFNKGKLEKACQNYKAMKDMKHRSDYLYDLYEKGYLGKVEGVQTSRKQNYYYVREGDVCLSINKEVTREDINTFNEKLNTYGINYEYQI